MEDAPTIAAWVNPGQERTAAGDEAFRQLYQATSRPLWGYLHHATGRPHVADDLLQETWCKFLLHPIPPMDKAHTRSYLFRIATNLLHNRSRSRDDAALEYPPEHADPPGNGAQNDQAARLDVQSAMRQLKPRERQLLWLAYVEGMSHAEIAAVTGLGAMSIRILLYRARQKASAILRPQRTEP